ncbi:MAG: hypothetical protein V7733_11280 [Paraglaciecola polaris]|uniref:hypothetical protein n=1 Tax=Paraglaciecola polaris TaxID=222814 RepID=UPI0030031539|tara:strand:+ start:2182 stop:2463 length:282 start_codon:yes stop_codon:yes gene_type:complete
MSREDSIKKEVFDIYVNYARSIGRDVSTVTADTKIAFPAGLKLSTVQCKSRKPELNQILEREGAILFVDSQVIAFSKIKDAQDEVWSRVTSVG